MISRAVSFWQCRASAVTMQPASSSCRNSAGTAVISLLFSATNDWPRVSPFSVAQTLTRWRALWPASTARRTALPSKATTSRSRCSLRPCVHSAKASAKTTGSSNWNTLLKVSWLAMPLGNGRNVRSHSSRDRPKSAMS